MPFFGGIAPIMTKMIGKMLSLGFGPFDISRMKWSELKYFSLWSYKNDN